MKTNKNDYVFIISHSGDRTNIMANFKVLDKETFIKYVKENVGSTSKRRREKFRYSPINGYCSHINGMTLEEFEECFEADTFDPEDVELIGFKKEIQLKYGLDANKKDLKPISNKDLVVGGVYTDKQGKYHVYLGKLKKTTIHTSYRDRSDRVEDVVEEGYGWNYETYWGTENSTVERQFSCCQILKSNRKVYEFTGEVLNLPELFEFNKTTGSVYFNNQKHFKVTIERI